MFDLRLRCSPCCTSRREGAASSYYQRQHYRGVTFMRYVVFVSLCVLLAGCGPHAGQPGCGLLGFVCGPNPFLQAPSGPAPLLPPSNNVPHTENCVVVPQYNGSSRVTCY